MPSDSFADLWSSSSPSSTTPSSRPQTLASQSSSSLSNGSRTSSRLDAFSLLAATTTTPSGSSSQTHSRAITPSLSSNYASKNTKAQGTGSSDAFSSLLGSSFVSSSSKDAASMSLADRQARSLQEQRSASQPKSGSNGLWDGLDMLVESSVPSLSSSSPLPTPGHDDHGDGDDWEFHFGSATTTTTAAAKPSRMPSIDEPQPRKADDADLFDFLSDAAGAASAKKPGGGPSPPLARTASPTFDPFDKFNNSAQARSQSSGGADQASDDPGDFDFGDREDGDGGHEYGDDEEILGILGGKTTRARVPEPDRNEVRLNIYFNKFLSQTRNHSTLNSDLRPFAAPNPPHPRLLTLSVKSSRWVSHPNRRGWLWLQRTQVSTSNMPSKSFSQTAPTAIPLLLHLNLNLNHADAPVPPATTPAPLNRFSSKSNAHRPRRPRAPPTCRRRRTSSSRRRARSG